MKNHISQLQPFIMKYFALALAAFSVLESVVSLSCYTDDGTIPLSVMRRPVFYEECNSYLARIGKKYNLAENGLGFDLSCYKMIVTTNNPSTNFMVKGCVPTGLCDTVVPILIEKELSKNNSISVKSMNCKECNTDGCIVY